jgi:hypothetical protein
MDSGFANDGLEGKGKTANNRPMIRVANEDKMLKGRHVISLVEMRDPGEDLLPG